MEYLTKPDAPHWSPGDAPDAADPPVTHEAEAWALWTILIDLWQMALLYGAMPSPLLIGDINTVGSKVRIRLVVPGLATHLQVYVRAVGSGAVYIEEMTSGFATGYPAQVLCQGDKEATTPDAAVGFPGEAAYETPTAPLQRLVLLPSGDSPFYEVDLDLWKEEEPHLEVLSIAFRPTRIEESLS